MKLSKQQIDAIVDKIKTVKTIEYKSKVEKAKKEQLKTKAPSAKKYYEIYKTLPKELINILYYRKDLSEKIILDMISNVKIENKFNANDFRNQIILASIDAQDLDELSKKLKINL